MIQGRASLSKSTSPGDDSGSYQLIGLVKKHWREIIVLLAGFAYYVIQTQSLAGWIIDDAGITFSYARSFAQGHGLVSQPGMPPVEGYSNFLWLLLMVPFFVAGLFDPVVTPKIISLIVVSVSFWFLHRIVMHLTGNKVWLSLVVLLLTATNASFVIWTCSGLENPLFVLLILMLLHLQLQFLRVDSSARLAIWIGLVAVGIALTRPDGIVYLGFFPVVVILSGLGNRKNGITALRSIFLYSGVVVGIYGAFLLFRYLYFGDTYPNTYYVKGGPSIEQVGQALILQGGSFERFRTLCSSIFGPAFWYAVPTTLIVSLVLGIGQWKKGRKPLLLTVGLTGLAGFVFLLLAHDWMGEYRFATAFFPLFYICLIGAVHHTFANLSSQRWLAISVQVLVIIAVLTPTIIEHQPRLEKYSARPRVSFVGIAANFADRFNRYADYLDLRQASFLTPDIGGTLFYSELKIYDLAGLCDRTIARTRGKDQTQFYDYVFDQLRPSFIHTHGYFTAVSKFDDDPRFLSDYVSINDYEDQYAKIKYGASRISGDFVRRDAIQDKQAQLDSMRQELAP